MMLIEFPKTEPRSRSSRQLMRLGWKYKNLSRPLKLWSKPSKIQLPIMLLLSRVNTTFLSSSLYSQLSGTPQANLRTEYHTEQYLQVKNNKVNTGPLTKNRGQLLDFQESVQQRPKQDRIIFYLTNFSRIL